MTKLGKISLGLFLSSIGILGFSYPFLHINYPTLHDGKLYYDGAMASGMSAFSYIYTKNGDESINLTSNQQNHITAMFHNISSIKCIQYNTRLTNFHQEGKIEINFYNHTIFDSSQVYFFEGQNIMYTEYDNFHPLFIHLKETTYSLYEVDQKDVDIMFNYVRSIKNEEKH